MVEIPSILFLAKNRTAMPLYASLVKYIFYVWTTFRFCRSPPIFPAIRCVVISDIDCI